MSYLPCGTYFESYADDQKWWRTNFIKGKMIFMVVLLAAAPHTCRFPVDKCFLHDQLLHPGGARSTASYRLLWADHAGTRGVCGCWRIHQRHDGLVSPLASVYGGRRPRISDQHRLRRVYRRTLVGLVRFAVRKGQRFLPDYDHDGRPVDNVAPGDYPVVSQIGGGTVFPSSAGAHKNRTMGYR